MSAHGAITASSAQVDYLQLMAVQLQNQDPFEPTKQDQMIKDLAQFSTLEGIEKLNVSFSDMLKMQEVTQGMGMIGKNVQYQLLEDGEIRSGVVQEVFTRNNNVSFMVDGLPVKLDNIISLTSVDPV